MKIATALLSGLAGACALTILNETIRRIDPDAPRLDLLGMNTVKKGIKKTGAEPPTGKNLYWTSMFTDIIGNTLYYSIAGLGHKKTRISKGLMLGLSAGISATSLPKTVGVSDKPVNKTDKTRFMTIAWYVIGGLVTSAVMKYTEERLSLGERIAEAA